LVLRVGLPVKKRPAVVYEWFSLALKGQEKIDQVPVIISQKVFFVISIQKHCSGTHERFDQAIAMGQHGSYALQDLILVAGPFQKRSTF
jgi:hypothetical protein